MGLKLRNDKFGIQTRGGCSCAGSYGHFLLHVDQETSHRLIDEITLGDLIRKPGWIRMSIHPTTTTDEVEFVCNNIKELAANHQIWALDYDYNAATNEFIHKISSSSESELVNKWFCFE